MITEGCPGHHFNTDNFLMRLVKTVTTADVALINSPHVTSTYEAALVFEWLLESQRFHFSPYTSEVIAGCGSILSKCYWQVSTERPQLVDDLMKSVEEALENGVDIKPCWW